MMTPTVSVLLSTYNGEKYLRELLDSLVSQNYSNYQIFIRDDRSTDQTQSILATYQEKFPDLIVSLKDDAGNVGVQQSFRRLMETATSDYYFFCDQDDIWDSDKIQKMVEIGMNDRESLENPYLLTANYRIIDDENTVVCSSSYNKYKLERKELERGLFRGFVPGCTMMFNEKIKEIFLENPDVDGLHDIKLLNLCFLFGKIELFEIPIMSYRVHDNNTVGIHQKPSTSVLLKDLLKYCFKSQKYRSIVLSDYFKMQSALLKHIDPQLLSQKEYFDEKQLKNLSLVKRKQWFRKHFKPYHRSFMEGVITMLLI